MAKLFSVSLVVQLSVGLSLSVERLSPATTGQASVGAYAPLTEDGYQSVAGLRDDDEMKAFVRRLLQNSGRSINDEAGLSGFVKFYSGTARKQSLTAMKEELANRRIAWWVEEGMGKTAPLSDAGLEKVAALSDPVQMRAFLRRMAKSAGQEIEDVGRLESLASELSGTQDEGRYQDVLDDLLDEGTEEDSEEVSASEAPLNEQGYKAVAALEDDEAMKVFVRRVLAAEGRSVVDDAGLSGFVPYFSGVKAVRDLYSLKAELRYPVHAWWIDAGVGRKAPLTEAGYQSVVAARDGRQMKAFIRRVANLSGKMSLSEGQLSGMVPFFSGERGSQTFAALKNQVATKSM